MLETKDLNVFYDTARVLNNVSVKVDVGELVGLVGSNGAGKSMLLRRITGLIKWEKDMMRGTRRGDITISGSVLFEGERIDNLLPDQVARKGLILCPERGRPFAEITVKENLEAGAYLRHDRKGIRSSLEKVYELFPRLKEREKQVSGTLSGGERQMLALGRALMSEPKLLLIDEPSTGLAPLLKTELISKIADIYRQLRITILLAEQDISFAFGLSNRNYLISAGKIVSEGGAEELLNDPKVRKTYLGV